LGFLHSEPTVWPTQGIGKLNEALVPAAPRGLHIRREADTVHQRRV